MSEGRRETHTGKENGNGNDGGRDYGAGLGLNVRNGVVVGEGVGRMKRDEWERESRKREGGDGEEEGVGERKVRRNTKGGFEGKVCGSTTKRAAGKL